MDLKLKDKEAWDTAVAVNVDPYGKCCIDVARRVMEKIDAGEEINPHKLICDADKEIGAGGITGYMAGAVASMISAWHEKGEEFKRVWNKGHGVENAKGTVNPALVTVNLK